MKQLNTSVITLALFLSTNLIFAQKSACLEKMKTGTFAYEANKGAVVITRTKKIHKETFNHGKSQLILKVNWENDSTYKVVLKKIINAPGKMKVGDWIVTTILTCEENRYEAKFTSNCCGYGKAAFIRTGDIE